MHVFESPQNLIHEILDVVVSQGLSRINNAVQIGFHQIIDDVSANTIVAASSTDKDLKLKTTNKTEISKIVGDSIGKKALKAGIKKISFDRNGYLYHGRVKSLAEGARDAGLNF